MLRAMYGFSFTDSFGRTEKYWISVGYSPPMTSALMTRIPNDSAGRIHPRWRML